MFGATGAQGGGLARALLADPASGFTVRAVTRKPDSDAGRALAKAGAEVVAADLDDAASVQRAMNGAYGAFCVTNFWEHFSPEKELAQAGAMADAAAKAGVQHVIWSTLEDTRDLLRRRRQAHAGADGQVQRPALRCQGRGERALHVEGADDAALHVVLLGQPDPLRHGTEEGAGRRARVHAADGGQAAVRHRGRGHRQVRLRHLPRGRGSRRQPRSASPAST